MDVQPQELVSKVQYKNFEPGEFVDRQARTCEQTIQQIESFPREPQRDHLVVSLTNPSVTLEGPDGGFLKLALYYNGRFVLHYFTLDHRLYTKSFARYPEAYPYWQSFFNGQPFDTTEFKLETTWMQSNSMHFPDKDFHYYLTNGRIRTFLISTSGISFLFTIIMAPFVLYNAHKIPFSAVFALLPLFFLVGGGLNLLLFANYYRHAKGKMLVMSRGNDLFYFGEAGAPEQFDKKDILQVILYSNPRNSSSRSPINQFAWVEIEMKNARCLIIPNLLIDETDFKNKLFEYPCEYVGKAWPSIPRAVSTPS